MDIEFLLLLALLPLASFLYSIVGHGGASSYILILTLLGLSNEIIRPTALILNILVSLLAFINFKGASKFQLKFFIVIILFSIPSAFLGGSMVIDEIGYKKLLGVILLFPAFKFTKLIKVSSLQNRYPARLPLIGLAGILIGFVSGLIGIGGGIILSPLLLLMGWSDAKQAASIAALFIFLNSTSALIGYGLGNIIIPGYFYYVIPLSIVGSILGSYFGAKKFSVNMIEKVLGYVLIIASFKLILT